MNNPMGGAQGPRAGASSQGGAAAAVPLRKATRQRWKSAGNPLPISFGGSQVFTMPQVGLINELAFQAQATISNNTGGTVTLLANTFGAGPFNLAKRITVSTNLGTAVIYDCSGYGASLVQQLYGMDINLRAAYGAGNTDAPDPLYNYPLGAVTNTNSVNLTCWWNVPIAVNDGDQFQLGMINLQAPEIRMTVQFQFGALADLYNNTDAVTIAGNVLPYYKYYDVPAPGKNVSMPPKLLFRNIEDRQAIGGAGQSIWTLVRGGRMMRFIHNFSLNGAIDHKTADVTNLQLWYNQTDVIYNIDTPLMLDIMARRYGATRIPSGAYVFDFFMARSWVNNSDMRDYVDSEKISTVEMRYTIAQGATFGSGNNYIDTVRQMIQGY